MRGAVASLAVCAALAAAVGAAQPRSDNATYRVECVDGVCRADLATYIGWRVFQGQCATCHAADARGSSYAPDLALLKNMTQREFFAALDRGYFGPQSAMP